MIEWRAYTLYNYPIPTIIELIIRLYVKNPNPSRIQTIGKAQMQIRAPNSLCRPPEAGTLTPSAHFLWHAFGIVLVCIGK